MSNSLLRAPARATAEQQHWLPALRRPKAGEAGGVCHGQIQLQRRLLWRHNRRSRGCQDQCCWENKLPPAQESSIPHGNLVNTVMEQVFCTIILGYSPDNTLSRPRDSLISHTKCAVTSSVLSVREAPGHGDPGWSLWTEPQPKLSNLFISDAFTRADGGSWLRRDCSSFPGPAAEVSDAVLGAHGPGLGLPAAPRRC